VALAGEKELIVLNCILCHRCNSYSEVVERWRRRARTLSLSEKNVGFISRCAGLGDGEAEHSKYIL